jgi:hypothetical protein
MKKLTFISAAVLSLLLTACLKNNDNCCTAPYQPYFVAERAGQQVYAEPGSAKVGTDSIAITGKSQTAGISMRIKFTGKGVYLLTGNQGKYYTKINSDTTSKYNIHTISASSLEVTDYDSTKHIIAGKFTLNFKKVFSLPSNSNPDSVKFTNGQFSVYLPTH